LESTPLQRALEAAPERPSAAEAVPEIELFCFRTGELHFGFASENVLQVIRPLPLTALPKVPTFILGVCAHRGEVLPVLGLLRFLSKGEEHIGSKTRFVIAVSGKYIAAIVADAVIGMRRYRLAQIDRVPLGSSESEGHLAGVVRTNRVDETILILDAAKLLQAARGRAVPG
jgi:purine-binding chemotaxis protein CheW